MKKKVILLYFLSNNAALVSKILTKLMYNWVDPESIKYLLTINLEILPSRGRDITFILKSLTRVPHVQRQRCNFHLRKYLKLLIHLYFLNWCHALFLLWAPYAVSCPCIDESPANTPVTQVWLILFYSIESHDIPFPVSLFHSHPSIINTWMDESGGISGVNIEWASLRFIQDQMLLW